MASGGLSCLQAVQRRLEEDRMRQRPNAVPPPRLSTTSITATETQHCPERPSTLASPTVQIARTSAMAIDTQCSPPVLAAGGAAHAASFLKSMAAGRESADRAPEQPRVDVEPEIELQPELVQPVVQPNLEQQRQETRPQPVPPPGPRPQRHSTDNGETQSWASRQRHQAAMLADAQARNTRARSQSNGLDEATFRPDPSNFSHILHFLRDGKGWQAPACPEQRASLRQEALYFGCPGIIQALDEVEGDEQNKSSGQMPMIPERVVA